MATTGADASHDFTAATTATASSVADTRSAHAASALSSRTPPLACDCWLSNAVTRSSHACVMAAFSDAASAVMAATHCASTAATCASSASRRRCSSAIADGKHSSANTRNDGDAHGSEGHDDGVGSDSERACAPGAVDARNVFTNSFSTAFSFGSTSGTVVHL